MGLQSISNYWWAAANIIGDWLLTVRRQLWLDREGARARCRRNFATCINITTD